MAIESNYFLKLFRNISCLPEPVVIPSISYCDLDVVLLLHFGRWFHRPFAVVSDKFGFTFQTNCILKCYFLRGCKNVLDVRKIVI